MNTVLFGFKGCGKTHFGKLLSAHLKRPFIDTDDLIVAHYKKGNHNFVEVREIYRHLGERAFRDMETELVCALEPNHSIIAVGGGAVLNPRNGDHLKQIGKMVYLKACFKTIQQRLTQMPAFVDKEDPSSLLRIYEHRIALYESLHTACIDVDQLNQKQILDNLLEIAHGI